MSMTWIPAPEIGANALKSETRFGDYIVGRSSGRYLARVPAAVGYSEHPSLHDAIDYALEDFKRRKDAEVKRFDEYGRYGENNPPLTVVEGGRDQ